MTIIKIGDKDYRIQYGYLATTKSKIIKDLASLDTAGNEIDMLDAVLSILPKMLLVGLQKFHKDEYGCDFASHESVDVAIDKIGELLDGYFDSSDSDIQELFTILQNELVANGFLSKSGRQKEAKQEMVQAHAES